MIIWGLDDILIATSIVTLNIVGIVLIYLKLCNIIFAKWLIVLSPFIILLAFGVILFSIAYYRIKIKK